ncbi:sigma-70 family RNA polymerase sigma factor [Nocardioides pantholopis]|uniref:sigma-70 family RNA polymerase sigma factor n=1 Tax=Nocardioides pantholopis TaxID=2483798 RepID=UPI001F15157A|nr:sigma-70 family RNA polymerase sigma factor [Nocardioides pantholopis]
MIPPIAPLPSPAASAAADRLAVDHVPLVAHLVRETMSRVPSHVDRDDLRSAGLAALVLAARAFEAERGVPFARYASTRIRGAIMDELRSVDWASRSVRRRGREVEEARNRLAVTIGQLPDNAAVAAALGIEAEEVTASDEDLTRASVLSLQATVEGPEGAAGSLAEALVSAGPTPEALVLHRERLQYLGEAIAELPARQRAVVEGYFLAEQPMAEIAEELGVSESRVSQIRAEAMVMLRDALNAALDPEQLAPVAKPGGCVARRRDAYITAVAERHAAARPVAVPDASRPAPRTA